MRISRHHLHQRKLLAAAQRLGPQLEPRNVLLPRRKHFLARTREAHQWRHRLPWRERRPLPRRVLCAQHRWAENATADDCKRRCVGYKEHTDCTLGSHKGKEDRFGTVLIYLSDVAKGGHTTFPSETRCPSLNCVHLSFLQNSESLLSLRKGARWFSTACHVTESVIRWRSMRRKPSPREPNTFSSDGENIQTINEYTNTLNHFCAGITTKTFPASTSDRRCHRFRRGVKTKWPFSATNTDSEAAAGTTCGRMTSSPDRTFDAIHTILMFLHLYTNTYLSKSIVFTGFVLFILFTGFTFSSTV